MSILLYDIYILLDYLSMGVLLVLGILTGVAVVVVGIDYVANQMYIMSENIYASIWGGYAPRSRRGSMKSRMK